MTSLVPIEQIPVVDLARPLVIAQLTPHDAERAWDRTMPFLMRAMQHGYEELTDSSIKGAVALGLQQIWVVLFGTDLTGVLLTEVTEYPGLKAVRVILMSGYHFRQWVEPMNEHLEDFARSLGATRLEAVGRRGLTKILQPAGWIPAYTTVIREVKRGKERRIKR